MKFVACMHFLLLIGLFAGQSKCREKLCNLKLGNYLQELPDYYG